MPKEKVNNERIALLVQCYAAGLVELTDEDKRKIEIVIKHPLR